MIAKGKETLQAFIDTDFRLITQITPRGRKIVPVRDRQLLQHEARQRRVGFESQQLPYDFDQSRRTQSHFQVHRAQLGRLSRGFQQPRHHVAHRPRLAVGNEIGLAGRRARAEQVVGDGALREDDQVRPARGSFQREVAHERNLRTVGGGHALVEGRDVRLQDGGLKPRRRHGRMFVGQRKDPFVVSLGRTFDLLHKNPVGPASGAPDDLADKNVTTLALEVPTTCLVTASNPIIGAWTTASEQKNDEGEGDGFGSRLRGNGRYTQVSRLGMPLVNEVVIGLRDKDKFNATKPTGDGAFLGYVQKPELAGLLTALSHLPKALDQAVVDLGLHPEGLTQPDDGAAVVLGADAHPVRADGALDDEQALRLLAELPLPAIDAGHGPGDVDAGREAPLDQEAGEPASGRLRAGLQDDDGALGFDARSRHVALGPVDAAQLHGAPLPGEQEPHGAAGRIQPRLPQGPPR